MTTLARALVNFAQWATRGCIIVDGSIVSVDKKKYTCVIDIAGVKYLNVPLKVLVGSQASMIEIPKLNTKCLMQFRDRHIGRPQLHSVHEVEEILINAPTVKFNGGENGGLIYVSKMVDQINKTEKKVNDILNVLKNTTIPLAPSGTYPFAPLYTSVTTLTETTISDIENDKILQ